MSTHREVQSDAAGKLIIAGEYAVLQGWPALVCVTDRRFKVMIKRLATETSAAESDLINRAGTISLVTKGLQSERHYLEFDAECGLKVSPSSPLCMFATCFNASATHFGLAAVFSEGAWHITLDSRELFDHGDKLGLGSSAAMTVAVDEALKTLARVDDDAASVSTQASRDEERPLRWSRLHAVHSRAQKKLGSGIDVAASLAAATCCFRNIEQRDCDMALLELPSALHFLFLWSGHSASTPGYLNSFSEWKEGNASACEHHMQALGSCSQSVIAACVSGDHVAFILALQDFTQALSDFDEASGVGVFGGGHEAVRQLSGEFRELVYKPCGAGGGDLGLAVSADKSELDAFAIRAQALGFRKVTMSIRPQLSVTAE